jgi:multiple sugar transport system ATP-binding protein
MAKVTLKNVYKVYPGDRCKEVTAVEDFSLDILDREFVVFVGPSGCGKSTTLRMIAGLEEISKGDVLIGDKRVNDLPPKDRDIAMVFQNYALYPHMNVYDNMAFGLELRKYPKAEIRKRVTEAAGILGIEQLLDRRPKALSGGQRQRVASGAPSCGIRKFFSSTNRSRISTPRCAFKCARRSRNSTSASKLR